MKHQRDFALGFFVPCDPNYLLQGTAVFTPASLYHTLKLNLVSPHLFKEGCLIYVYLYAASESLGIGW